MILDILPLAGGTARLVRVYGGVGAVGVGVGIIGSRHGAGARDIKGQHDAEDDVQHQHEDNVAGHVFFHGL